MQTKYCFLTLQIKDLKKTVRIVNYILPVVAGTMSGMMLTVFGEMSIHHLYPPPVGISLENKVALAEFIASMPVKAFMLLLANYAVCSFIAGIVATIVAGRNTKIPAIIVGMLISLCAIYNIVKMPSQPMWFVAFSILLHIPLTLLGYYTARKKG